eukprot:4887714-Pleurochrysis_carterae.AAC.1
MACARKGQREDDAMPVSLYECLNKTQHRMLSQISTSNGNCLNDATPQSSHLAVAHAVVYVDAQVDVDLALREPELEDRHLHARANAIYVGSQCAQVVPATSSEKSTRPRGVGAVAGAG